MKSLFDNDNIDELFRNELKDHRVAAPKGVWDKINAQLQIKRNPLPWYLAASVFITVLFAVGIWSNNFSNSFSKNNTVKTKATNNLAVTAPVNNTPFKNSIAQNTVVLPVSGTLNAASVSTEKKVISTTQHQQANNLSFSSPVATTSSSNLTAEQGNKPNVTTSSAINTATEESDELQNMPPKIAGSVALVDTKHTISYDAITQSTISATPATLNNKNIKGFYAGVNSSANSVWVLDRVALDDNNFRYQLTPGFTYGVQGGYNFSNNFGLETGLTFNARDGQKYIFYLNNIDPENKSVVLNYTEIPLVAKLKIPQIAAFTAMPIILNINFGFSYGYLRSAYTFVNGDKVGSQNQYPNNQINALAGFSYDIYTKHSFSYSIGLMAEYGINTTNNDDNNQSGSTVNAVAPTSRYSNGSDFSEPHNLSVGITAAINYDFSLFRR